MSLLTTARRRSETTRQSPWRFCRGSRRFTKRTRRSSRCKNVWCSRWRSWQNQRTLWSRWRSRADLSETRVKESTSFNSSSSSYRSLRTTLLNSLLISKEWWCTSMVNHLSCSSNQVYSSRLDPLISDKMSQLMISHPSNFNLKSLRNYSRQVMLQMSSLWLSSPSPPRNKAASPNKTTPGASVACRGLNPSQTSSINPVPKLSVIWWAYLVAKSKRSRLRVLAWWSSTSITITNLSRKHHKTSGSSDVRWVYFLKPFTEILLFSFNTLNYDLRFRLKLFINSS